MTVLHFHEAVRQHLKWLDDLIECLTGGRCNLRLDEVKHDDRCVIGRWLHGEGQDFAHLKAFQKVDDLHKKIHHTAAQAWDAKDKGDQHAMEASIKDLHELKHQLFMAWNEFNSIIGSLD